MNEELKPISCGIEHHAVLFALLMKHAMIICSDRGWRAAQEGVTLYAEERGRRMAENAKTEGEPLTITACQIFGEWVPEFEGQMISQFNQFHPTLQTHVSKCAWCDAWKKHDLMEYGKYYCVTVDDGLARGFSPELRCRPLVNLSWGAEVCILDWCHSLTEEELSELKRKKQSLGNRYIKDFNFHTAHLLHTVGGTISNLGEEGERAVQAATDEFVATFGQAYFDALQGRYPEESLSRLND